MSRNSVEQTLRRALTSLQKGLRSSKGKDVLIYLLFVLVAFVFWVLLSLDTEVSKDYDVPIVVSEVPDSIHLIGNTPATINVSVRSKGAQLLRYEWGKMPVLNLRFRDFSTQNNRFYMSRTRLNTAMRDFFGNAVTVNAVKPDSISVPFTSSPGVKMPLLVVSDIHTDLQYTLSGPIRANVDSVTLYSLEPLPKDMAFVYTEPLVRHDLRDTVRTEVSLKPVPGVKIVPSKVTVTIPVEPLISKRREVQIDVLGLPANTSMITFPARATISYLLPMSAYNHDFPVKVFVDYSLINYHTGKAPLQVGAVPPPYSNLTFEPDSVEFIIERH